MKQEDGGTQRRVLGVENASVGSGKDKEDRIRSYTLVEKMYNEERDRRKKERTTGAKSRPRSNEKWTLTFSMLMAADRYRELYLDAHGTSIGVSSYGQSPGGGSPSWNKSGTTDRRLHNGSALEAARFAMCGLEDSDSRRQIDKDLVTLMEEAIIETTNIPTQSAIGMKRTGYDGAMQIAAAGASIIAEALRRLVIYFGYERQGR